VQTSMAIHMTMFEMGMQLDQMLIPFHQVRASSNRRPAPGKVVGVAPGKGVGVAPAKVVGVAPAKVVGVAPGKVVDVAPGRVVGVAWLMVRWKSEVTEKVVVSEVPGVREGLLEMQEAGVHASKLKESYSSPLIIQVNA